MIIVGVLLLLGFVGSFVPVLPGPPLSYLALLISNFYKATMDWDTVIVIGVVVALITFLDFWLQVYGVKKFGGGKKATNGAIAGLLAGIFFFPPFGVLIGPFLGAYIGARMESKEGDAVKIAFGALLGFLGGTILKLGMSFYITFIIFF